MSNARPTGGLPTPVGADEVRSQKSEVRSQKSELAVDWGIEELIDNIREQKQDLKIQEHLHNIENLAKNFLKLILKSR